MKNKSKAQINSVLKPVAQTSILLQPEYKAATMFSSRILHILERKDISEVDKAVIELLYLFGLRISEVLRILPSDIMPTGSILIKTSKHGEKKIVTPVMMSAFWRLRSLAECPINETRSRWYYYRLFKKLGLYASYGKNKNNAVTHFFRHELVLQLENSGVDGDTISYFLGHKSKKSREYYEQKRK